MCVYNYIYVYTCTCDDWESGTRAMGDPGVLVMVPVQAAVGVGMRQLLCSAVLQLSSSAISTSSSGERTRIIIINYV